MSEVRGISRKEKMLTAVIGSALAVSALTACGFGEENNNTAPKLTGKYVGPDCSHVQVSEGTVSPYLKGKDRVQAEKYAQHIQQKLCEMSKVITRNVATTFEGQNTDTLHHDLRSSDEGNEFYYQASDEIDGDYPLLMSIDNAFVYKNNHGQPDISHVPSSVGYSSYQSSRDKKDHGYKKNDVTIHYDNDLGYSIETTVQYDKSVTPQINTDTNFGQLSLAELKKQSEQVEYIVVT